jgi:hypothetical protein
MTNIPNVTFAFREGDLAPEDGGCPHQPSMVDSILADPYKSRFYNLLKFLRIIK